MTICYMLEHGDIKFLYRMMRTPRFYVKRGMGPQFPWGNGGGGGPVIFSRCVMIMGLSEVTKYYNILWTKLCTHCVIMDMMTLDICFKRASLIVYNAVSAHFLYRTTGTCILTTEIYHVRKDSTLSLEKYQCNIFNSQLYTMSLFVFPKKSKVKHSIYWNMGTFLCILDWEDSLIFNGKIIILELCEEAQKYFLQNRPMSEWNILHISEYGDLALYIKMRWPTDFECQYHQDGCMGSGTKTLLANQVIGQSETFCIYDVRI